MSESVASAEQPTTSPSKTRVLSRFELPIFHIGILLLVDPDLEDLKNFLADSGVKDGIAAESLIATIQTNVEGKTITGPDMSGPVVIWLRRWNAEDPHSTAILVHELVHAAEFIMAKLEMRRAGVGEEFRAYVTQWLFEQAWAILEEGMLIYPPQAVPAGVELLEAEAVED